MGVVSHLQYPSDRVFTVNAAPEHDLWSGLDKKEGFSLDLFSASNPLTSLMFGNASVYRFEASEVPLPPALLLFATAPGGMVVFGDRRRNTPA
jgi:hypothetical protein